MPDTEPKSGATAAAWTDKQRMALLIVVAEHALKGSIESKLSQAPLPSGRTVIACRNVIIRLKKELKDDIESIKAGKTTQVESEGAVKQSPCKRKAPEDDAKTPKKKAASRGKCSEAVVKAEPVEDEI
ncbi:hypothetical protein B5807_11012 [Epicoccum nigrum]|uniref:Uncharacterized protein n=1 Tax=Epicoccum nigrum TaxID=105696 RepID=A0A1Y2LJZ3_EPING|nr:hypothetical protein B5807_11012 [Epicoccum nigrum]